MANSSIDPVKKMLDPCGRFPSEQMRMMKMTTMSAKGWGKGPKTGIGVVSPGRCRSLGRMYSQSLLKTVKMISPAPKNGSWTPVDEVADWRRKKTVRQEWRARGSAG